MEVKEKLYFQDREVTITEHRTIIKGTVYPIKHIAAVSVKSNHPHIPAAILLLFAGMLPALLWYVDFVGWGYLIAGIVISGLSIPLFILQEHRLEVERSSGKSDTAFKTRNATHAYRVRDAINSALMGK